jgi:hypothetical protein
MTKINKQMIIIGLLTMVNVMSYAQEKKTDTDNVNISSKTWRDLQQKVDDLATDQMAFLSFGALLEFEAGYNSESDDVNFSLSTLELGLEAEISSWVRAEVIFLYEEDDTDPIDVDTAIISIGNIEEYPIFAQAGRMYVPFGNYHSFSITDPLTLELGETRETAGLIGFEYVGFSGIFAGFNGDVETDGKDTVNNFAVALSYTYEHDHMSVNLGGSYIYNISDSDGLQDYVSELDDIGATAGFNAFLTAAYMGFDLSVEYVTAIDELADDLAVNPSALSIDLGYEFSDVIAAALRYETANEVKELKLPEDRYGVCIGWKFNLTELGSATLTAEYMHEEYADDSDNNLVILQVSFEI